LHSFTALFAEVCKVTAQSNASVGPPEFDAEKHAELLRARAVSGAPHAIPIWQLLGRGVSLLTLPANGLPFSLPPGLSWITILRDEAPEGGRHYGFHADSLDRLVGQAHVWAIMVPPVDVEPYAEAYEALGICGQKALNIVIVETTMGRECEWFAYLSVAAPYAGKLWVSPSVGGGTWSSRPAPTWRH
jgi:hypothetical protein